jgi:Tol biopolymer transport system component
MKLRVLLAGLTLAVVCMAAEPGVELHQKAVTLERAGKLDDAITLYEKVAHDFASDHPLAAKALMAAARCTETLGRDNAAKLYEQVTREYGDQRDLAQTARSKLAALRQPAPTTMTQRRIESPGVELDQSAYTDGQRAVFFDERAGGLVIGDVAGKERKVIRKAKRADLRGWIPSRDFSMVLLTFPPDPNGLARLAVVRADGTGNEIAVLKYVPGGLCSPSWSWDNRFVLACDVQPDGSRRFLSISVDNGQTRELLRGETTIGARPAFSPDGRFIAYGDGRRGQGNVFILPMEGGSPRLVFSNGSFLDWTRDGHHLLIVSRRSGAEGLYLLPVKKDQPAGDPFLVRYGSFANGHTTANGAFVYQAVPPGGNWKTSIAGLDPEGRLGQWKELSLKVGGAAGPSASWSPDSSQIAYTATRDDFGQPGSVVLVRNMATGEEREVYRDTEQVWCVWAPQPNLVCERTSNGAESLTDIFSVALNSGQPKALVKLPRGGSGIWANRDGRTFDLFSAPEMRWYAWEMGAEQAKVLDQERVRAILIPSEKWFPRIVNRRELEIRPTSGGPWKHLVTLNSEIGLQNFPLEYTPDGKWILYGDKDSSGRDSLFRISPARGQPERLGDFPSGYLRECLLDLSPDGRQILAQASRAVQPELWLLENFEPKPQPGR